MGMYSILINWNGQKKKKQFQNSVSERAVLLSDIDTQDIDISGSKPSQFQLFIVLTGVITVWVLVANCQIITMTFFFYLFSW